MKLALQKHFFYLSVVIVVDAWATDEGIMIPSQFTECAEMYIEQRPIIVQLKAKKTMMMKAEKRTLNNLPHAPTS